MNRLDTINSASFSKICDHSFGRKVIKTAAKSITKDNVVKEMQKALYFYEQNKHEINYLHNYYKGSQPILSRVKEIRPEINNRIVINHAYEIVEFKTALNFSESIKYARQGTDDENSEKIRQLNAYMQSENKDDIDIEIGRWRSICGTAYRFIYIDNEKQEFDETPFGLECLDPRFTAVVYSTGDGQKPLFAFMERLNENNEIYYVVYTRTHRYEILNDKVIDITANGMFRIPIVEYPNNHDRLSDIELVSDILDGINKVQSDRLNGVEQFVQSLMKFINCEVNETVFKEMVRIGAVSVETKNPNAKSDIEIMTAELNQEQTQLVIDDLYNRALSVLGMPSREQNTGGDTGQAVYLRNGWDFAEQRAKINEPIIRRAEREFLKIALSILDIKRNLGLKISDIEIKMPRSQMDNLSVKVNALTLLIKLGIDPQIAIKTVSIWSDSEEVYIRSKEGIERQLTAQTSPKQIQQQTE